MFANSFQSGPHVEVFDAKINREKNQFYTKLVKLITPSGIKKQFDKETKSYLIQIDGLSRLSFPFDEQKELCLMQRYLVLQIFIPVGFPWAIELGITDTSKTKRRVMLTSAVNKIESKFFHVRCPINEIKRGIWLNLSIDVYSYMNAFKGQTFRSLDQIIIGANCKLKRILTMREGLIQYSNQEEIYEYNNEQGKVFMPKQFQLNPDVIQTTQTISYNSCQQKEQKSKEAEQIVNAPKSFDKKPLSKNARKPSVSVRQKQQESKMFEIQKLPVIPIPKTIPINKTGGVKSRIDTGLTNNRSSSTKIETNLKKQIIKEEQKQPNDNKSTMKFENEKQVIKESKLENITRTDQLKKQLEKYEDEQFEDQLQNEVKKPKSKQKPLEIKNSSKVINKHALQKQSSDNQFVVSPSKLVKEVKQEEPVAKTSYEEYEEEYDYGEFEDSIDRKDDSFEDSMDPKVHQKQSVYNKPADNMFPTSIITKKNEKTVVVEMKPEEHVDLIYDEVLDCYFNPKTNTYYELS